MSGDDDDILACLVATAVAASVVRRMWCLARWRISRLYATQLYWGKGHFLMSQGHQEEDAS